MQGEIGFRPEVFMNSAFVHHRGEPSSRWRGFLCACLALVVGCSSTPEQVALSQAAKIGNLQKIRVAYDTATEKLGRPPANEKEAWPFLEALGDPGEILKSKVDGEPYVVLWGVNLRTVEVDMPPAIIAYEKSGRSGSRYVLTMLGCALYDDVDFQNSPKIK